MARRSTVTARCLRIKLAVESHLGDWSNQGRQFRSDNTLLVRSPARHLGLRPRYLFLTIHPGQLLADASAFTVVYLGHNSRTVLSCQDNLRICAESRSWTLFDRLNLT